MKIRPIALYPGRLTDGRIRTDVRIRGKGAKCRTQIGCRLDQRPHGTFAVPVFLPPDGVEAPSFRLQLTVPRIILTNPRRTAVVLQATNGVRPADPEQRLLRPLFHDDVRMTFEFILGDVLSVCSDGSVDLRHAAIDPRTGQVGTERVDVGRAFSSLIDRLNGELTARSPLFDAGQRQRPPIPEGIPDLYIGTRPATRGTLFVRLADED